MTSDSQERKRNANEKQKKREKKRLCHPLVGSSSSDCSVFSLSQVIRIRSSSLEREVLSWLIFVDDEERDMTRTKVG